MWSIACLIPLKIRIRHIFKKSVLYDIKPCFLHSFHPLCGNMEKGGEKAMAMYVPLFSAVVAKYAGARPDAPKLISLDEAFAGVDETNIRDMFRLMVEFEFNFMINSQILWGDYDTVPGLAIYQLIRPENAKFVSVIRYIWNGKVKVMLTGEES